MRNRIFGGIGVLWGGAILANWLLADTPSGSAAYNAGTTAGVVFGAIMFVAGLYYLFRNSSS